MTASHAVDFFPPLLIRVQGGLVFLFHIVVPKQDSQVCTFFVFGVLFSHSIFCSNARLNLCIYFYFYVIMVGDRLAGEFIY